MPTFKERFFGKSLISKNCQKQNIYIKIDKKIESGNKWVKYHVGKLNTFASECHFVWEMQQIWYMNVCITTLTRKFYYKMLLYKNLYVKLDLFSKRNGSFLFPPKGAIQM